MVTMPNNYAETGPVHLGDGAYAQTSNGHLVITTGSHLVDSSDNAIYLGPEELAALEAYIAKAKANKSI